MTKQQILDYIKNTPENSNLNVLNTMLSQYGGDIDEIISTYEEELEERLF